jgi:hypothetical protein
MKRVRLFYSIVNDADGSAYPKFFSSMEEADEHQASIEEDHTLPEIR